MARPQGINQKAYYRAHSIRLARYADRVQSVYDALNDEVAKAVAKSGYDGAVPFSFWDYPITKKTWRDVQFSFVKDMRAVIHSGTSEEWKESNLVQDLLADKVLNFYDSKARGVDRRVYYQTNSDALKAFQERRDRGMNLSQKIWNMTGDYKDELECAISSAVEKGTSAVTLSKQLSKYLNDFDSLKQDYKEKYGKAVTCYDCEYRSIRLARTEINMAYRKAEQERWKQFDFVLGYEVKTTQNGLHETDICDELAGRYPKNFIFMGWHPNCMCYSIPILETEEQFWNNEEVEGIFEPPRNFIDWVERNEGRLEDAATRGTLPYWYADNPDYVDTKFWDNYAKMDRYDKRTYRRVNEWKDALGLDTSKLESLMRTRYEGEYISSDIWNELEDLNEKLGNVKNDYSDRYYKIRDFIYDRSREEYGVDFYMLASDKLSPINYYLKPFDVEGQFNKLAELEKYIDTFKNGLVSVVRPSYIDDVFAGGCYTPEEYKEVLGYLCGTRKRGAHGFKDWLVKFEKASGDEAFKVMSDFQTFLLGDEGAVWKCIDDYAELANAKDLGKIPKRWRLQFNQCMAKIERYDIETWGYGGLYNTIEEAYNIYKLSTLPEVAEYGVSRVSSYCPHNLFTIWKKAGYSFDSFPTQDFFRKLGKFYPLYDDMTVAVGDWVPRSSAHCHYGLEHVAISRSYFDKLTGRGNNLYKVKSVIYHEWGHAFDHTFDIPNYKELQQKPRFVRMFEKWEAKYNSYSEEDLRKKFWDAWSEYANKRHPGVSSFTDPSLNEMSISLSDTIQSLRTDKLMIDGGHYGTYFDLRSSRFTEFIAHMSENYWLGNGFFEYFDEELFKDMTKIMRVAVRGGNLE